MSKKTPMTQKAASRITSATAKQSGGSVPSKSFAARAERAAAHHKKPKQ
ncbi:hypothetical protein [Microbulbifer sp. YPW1]|nr:hypothetical protein [Microbulbifer sp. YPW1]QKX17311.1 hypothetical protein HUW35_10040 [Microbulbifer sp. YPW1]